MSAIYSYWCVRCGTQFDAEDRRTPMCETCAATAVLPVCPDCNRPYQRVDPRQKTCIDCRPGRKKARRRAEYEAFKHSLAETPEEEYEPSFNQERYKRLQLELAAKGASVKLAPPKSSATEWDWPAHEHVAGGLPTISRVITCACGRKGCNRRCGKERETNA